MRVSPESIHECAECSYVASKENIFIDQRLLRRMGEKPIFLGAFTMPGWSGHGNFYLLKCSACGTALVDYPHGYQRDGSLYFSCYNCPAGSMIHSLKYTAITIKDPQVYKREKIAIPGKEDKIKTEGFKTIASDNDRTILIIDGSKAAKLLDQSRAIRKNKSRIVFSILAVLITALITSILAKAF